MNTLKTALVSSTMLALAAATSASAADLAAAPYTKAPPVSPAYDWSGYYVGVFGGGGFTNHDISNFGGTANYGGTGGVVGGAIGANWQFGTTVLGLEADGAWTDIKSDDAFALGPNDATAQRWTTSVRARAGWAIDRFLVFFTGGWAYGSLRHTDTDPVLGRDSFTANRSGWTAGGGLDYAFTPELIGTFDYRYSDFGSFSRGGAALTPNGQLPYRVNSTLSTVTVGLAYKFGGPVVARY
ncbi:MAG: outer membrane protein [Pseudomonadota bacterium]|jgi:outer membrane immunogenic protein